MRDEGGSSFNPHDKGNVVTSGIVTVPTYKGIAPVFWGGWRGFAIIKQAITNMTTMPTYGTSAFRNWRDHLDSILARNEVLQRCVLEFYEANFWRVNRLGEIVSQPVATWAYNHIVNGGARGVKWLQSVAGVTPDGSIGPKTIAAINAMDPAELLRLAEDEAGCYRLQKAHDDATQIQFLPFWLRRDGLSNEEIQRIMAAVKDGELDDAELASLQQMIEVTA
jgi:lysozyme family protein